jgi:ariadne-1
MIESWKETKIDQDIESKIWISNNSKPCPKCKANIQQTAISLDQSSMICEICKHEFCWICMVNWCDHDCDPSKPTVAAMELTACEHRFVTNKLKHKIMKEAYTKDCEKYNRVNELKTINEPLIELKKQWINVDKSTAFEILLESRRTLMHSYIFSFFKTSVYIQTHIFEDNLKHLEECTEQLANILERQIDAINVNEIKGKILNITNLCKKRRRNLIDHINIGNERKWWREFSTPPTEFDADLDETIAKKKPRLSK